MVGIDIGKTARKSMTNQSKGGDSEITAMWKPAF